MRAVGAPAADSQAGESGSLRHLPALDGLRGIAILLVILIHSWVIQPVSRLDQGITFFVGIGWSGVDLFFVLSGFLITGILLDAKGGKYYFRSFYLRRVLRIFPLYYAFIAIHFVAAAALPYRLGHAFVSPARGQELWYMFFLSNFLTDPHIPVGLRVLWSLAVEEQFYVVWPLLVWLLPRHWLLRLSLALVPLSFAWRVGVVAAGMSADAPFLATPSQFGAIAAGAAIAIWQRRTGGIDRVARWARLLLLAIPLLLIPIGMRAVAGNLHFSTADPLMMTVGLLLFQLFYSAALASAVAARPERWTSRLLRSRALRACGRWSYSMYLFHTSLVPAITLVTGRTNGRLVLGSALPKQLIVTSTTVAASLALGALSWRLYEQRFLRLKRLFPMPVPRKVILDVKPVPASVAEAGLAQPKVTSATSTASYRE